jgi:hypothetical protein
MTRNDPEAGAGAAMTRHDPEAGAVYGPRCCAGGPTAGRPAARDSDARIRVKSPSRYSVKQARAVEDEEDRGHQ